MKGVKAVVTWKDVPVLEYGHLSGLGIPADEPLLAKDEVRYLGQPIAVVAAEDEDTAMAAVEAITAEFEELEPLLDVRKAWDKTAPTIHQWGNHYPHFEGGMDRRQIRKGNVAGRVRPGRPDRPGRLPPRGDRARAARDAGRRRSFPSRAAG